MLGDPTAERVEPPSGRVAAGPLRGVVASALVVATVTAGLAVGAPASADPDELPPSQDNPPGCTTATSSSAPGCGAQGRDHFNNPDHRPPVKACDHVRSPAGSLVTRVVPRGPLRGDGTLAFTSGACIYLPPGYDTGKLR